MELKNTRNILDHDNIGDSSEDNEPASASGGDDKEKDREERRERREKRRKEKKEKRRKKASNDSSDENENNTKTLALRKSPSKRTLEDSDGATSGDSDEKRKLVNRLDIEQLRTLAVRHVSLDDIQVASQVRNSF